VWEVSPVQITGVGKNELVRHAKKNDTLGRGGGFDKGKKGKNLRRWGPPRKREIIYQKFGGITSDSFSEKKNGLPTWCFCWRGWAFFSERFIFVEESFLSGPISREKGGFSHGGEFHYVGISERQHSCQRGVRLMGKKSLNNTKN